MNIYAFFFFVKELRKAKIISLCTFFLSFFFAKEGSKTCILFPGIQIFQNLMPPPLFHSIWLCIKLRLV
jgi:hypothetical protein